MNGTPIDPPPLVPAGGMVGLSATGEELGVYDADGQLLAHYRLNEAGDAFVLVPTTKGGAMRNQNVQVEGLEIGGMTAGTVRIGGREVEIGEDGRPIEEDDTDNEE